MKMSEWITFKEQQAQMTGPLGQSILKSSLKIGALNQPLRWLLQ